MVTHITLTNFILANNCLQANWKRDKIGYIQLKKKTEEKKERKKKAHENRSIAVLVYKVLVKFP